MFQRLSRIAEFERMHLTDLSDVDRWLVIRIGATAEAGQPISLKQLYLCEIAPKATVRRRLDRLRAIGLIHEQQDLQDLRTVRLAVTAKGLELFSKYEDYWCNHCRRNRK